MRRRVERLHRRVRQIGNLIQSFDHSGRLSKGCVDIAMAAAVSERPIELAVPAKRFKVTENGSPRTASGLEVIITRLISKEIAGDREAMAVRLKYLAWRPSPEGGT